MKRKTNVTKGAFGGTGTGRNLRGKPGRKLLKRTAKAGWFAQKRVFFGMSKARAQHNAAIKMTENTIREAIK
jgi:hypothetical protein